MLQYTTVYRYYIVTCVIYIFYVVVDYSCMLYSIVFSPSQELGSVGSSARCTCAACVLLFEDLYIIGTLWGVGD